VFVKKQRRRVLVEPTIELLHERMEVAKRGGSE
jgi:hypothetical protein